MGEGGQNSREKGDNGTIDKRRKERMVKNNAENNSYVVVFQDIGKNEPGRREEMIKWQG